MLMAELLVYYRANII